VGMQRLLGVRPAEYLDLRDGLPLESFHQQQVARETRSTNCCNVCSGSPRNSCICAQRTLDESSTSLHPALR
jgi:hypothetical protein